MKKISVVLDTYSNLEVDFGGDLDDRCCGDASRLFKDELYRFGIKISTQSVKCRLPADQRTAAKLSGKCAFDIPLSIGSVR